MNSSLKRMGLGMRPDEVISVGKHWLWMTVFSTCLFASCGETNRQPQEPASPEPQAQAVQARYDREDIRAEDVEEIHELEFDQLEKFSDSDFDESDFEDLERFDDLERFEDEEIRPDILHEVR